MLPIGSASLLRQRPHAATEDDCTAGHLARRGVRRGGRREIGAAAAAALPARPRPLLGGAGSS